MKNTKLYRPKKTSTQLRYDLNVAEAVYVNLSVLAGKAKLEVDRIEKRLYRTVNREFKKKKS